MDRCYLPLIVVIGDGNTIHSSGFGDPIELNRLGEAFRATDLLQNPLRWPLGMPGMDVKIDAHLHLLGLVVVGCSKSHLDSSFVKVAIKFG